MRYFPCIVKKGLTLLLLFWIGDIYGQEYQTNGAGTAATASCGVGTSTWNPGPLPLTTGTRDFTSTFATLNASDPGISISQCIQWANYGFSIPADATIVGVEALIFKDVQGAFVIVDHAVHLTLPGGGLSATNQALTEPWSSVGTRRAQIHGGLTDTWGEALTPAIVNDPAFGLSLEVTETDPSGFRAVVDAAEMIIYYHRCGSDKIVGKVFRDADMDGTLDKPHDSGIGNVTVRAFDATGTELTNTISTPGGDYVLNIPDGTDVRIEFENYPSYLETSFLGNEHESTVQFVTSPACEQNLGLQNPGDYCQEISGLYNSAVCYVRDGNDADAVFSFEYDAGAMTGGLMKDDWDDPAPNHIALSSEVGSVWGLAWDRTRQNLYAGAFLKIQAPFTTDGPGAIFQTSIDPVTGMLVGSPSLLVDVATLPGQTMCPTNIHGPDLDVYHQPAWEAVGKCGLGDVDINSDDTRLYTINLFNRQILELDITGAGTPTLSNNWDFPITGPDAPTDCTGDPDDIRPFALKYKDGLLYIGAVCTAESTVTIPGNPTGDINQLRAYVYTLDPTTGTFAQVLNFTLEPKNNGNPGRIVHQQRKWHAWMPDYRPLDSANPPPMAGNTVYPTPWFCDIEFHGDDMILGFRDRFGDQWGAQMNYPDPSVLNGFMGIQAQGDLYKSCWNPVTSVFEIEQNGLCGLIQNRQYGGLSPSTDEQEFYYSDGIAGHHEVSFGGLFQHRNDSLVNYTSMNPPNTVGVANANTGGISRANNFTGAGGNAYISYGSGSPGSFAKASGMGDIEGLCFSAPLEIGNRIWNDIADDDGIQDPGEPVFTGVIVNLFDATGTQVGTTTTDGNGVYKFNDSNVTMNGANGLIFGATYYIALDPSQFSASGQTLTLGGTSYGLTMTDIGMGTVPDLNDNDASLASGLTGGLAPLNGLPIIQVMAGNAGQNNHSLDMGFGSPPPCNIAMANDTTTCADNGTSTDSTDDTFTITFNPSGASLTSTYSISGDATLNNVAYGANSPPIGPFPISGGNVNFTLTDDTDNTCTLNVVVSPPVTCSNCPTITNPTAAQAICDGATVPSLEVSTTATAPDQIEFVYFASQQAGTAMYTGGTSLGVVAPVAGMASISNVGFPSAGTFYVYAIISPTPTAADCRSNQEIIVTVNPLPDVTLVVSDTTICDETDALIRVVNSEVGVSYQLREDATDAPVGSPLLGTGGTINLTASNLTPIGTYTYNVFATNSTTGCTGELTDMAIVMVQPCDYTFPNPICDSPPCHFTSADIYLGAGVTADDPATGESLPDDGIVRIPNDIQPNIQIHFPLTVFNNTGQTAFLTGWIDWNGDGDFDDTNEQIANEMYLFIAPNTGTFVVSLPVFVPSNTALNQNLAMRFRLSTDGSNIASPCGLTSCAGDGEVEDYFIQVTCPPTICLPPTITIIRN